MTEHHAIQAPRARGSAILAVAACAILWSSGGLFVKLIAWNPFAIAGVRSLIGGLVILLFLRRPRFTWSLAQIAGAVCYAGCMILFVTANKLTTAANAILLQYTAPLYAAVLGWIFLKEKAYARDWVTMAAVIGGMVLFFMDSLTLGGMQGNLLAILSGVFFAGAMVSFRAQKDGSSLESILLSHGITLAVSIPFLWQGAPTLAGWGALAVPGSISDRPLFDPPDLRREARDRRAGPSHRDAGTALQSDLGLSRSGRAPGAARAAGRGHHPGCRDRAIPGQPSIGDAAGRCRLTSRTPARITAPPTSWLQTMPSPRRTTPPRTPTTGMRLMYGLTAIGPRAERA